MSDPSHLTVNEPELSLPADVPAEVVPYLREMDYLTPDRLHVGDKVDPITLTALAEGRSVVICGASPRPTVLIFGSYT